MPRENFKYMLRALEMTKFRYDKEYAKREGICTCSDFGKPMVREIKILEIDTPTPITKDFEVWLSEWGFTDLFFQARKKYRGFAKLIPFAMKVFYKIINTFLQFLCAGSDMNKYRWITEKLKAFGCHGTIYRLFSPMSRRFARELPPPYKARPHYNQRNFIIGKTIEYPVGSFELRGKKPCPKCGAFKSQH